MFMCMLRRMVMRGRLIASDHRLEVMRMEFLSAEWQTAEKRRRGTVNKSYAVSQYYEMIGKTLWATWSESPSV